MMVVSDGQFQPYVEELDDVVAPQQARTESEKAHPQWFAFLTRLGLAKLILVFAGWMKYLRFLMRNSLADQAGAEKTE